jgi:hypothetical protein
VLRMCDNIHQNLSKNFKGGDDFEPHVVEGMIKYLLKGSAINRVKTIINCQIDFDFYK